MIGVDSNVLARLFVADDARQHVAAKRFFSERNARDPAYVSLVVVAEFVWLLDRTFDYSKPAILYALTNILGSDDFAVERRELVEFAVDRAGGSRADVADLLIAGVARANGASTTVTFDADAARFIEGMELLK